MAENTGHAMATTGVAELHHEPTAFGINAAGWVALSMLVVVALMLWQKVPALVGRILDARIAKIREMLDEASTLRAEAETMLADAKSRMVASAGDAQAIVSHAEAEAKHLIEDAKAKAADLTQRRQKMAEDKIGAAERAAIADVRARAASAAAGIAAHVIRQSHDASADAALVDATIKDLQRA